MSITAKTRRIHSAGSASSILHRTPKLRMEEAALRREAVVRDREFWTHTSKYFDTLKKQTDRFEAWNSDEVLKKSQEAYAKVKYSVTDEESKREERIERRNLEMESARKEFEAELKLNRTSQRARASVGKSLYDLRNDYERLQSLRYERQQKEAEEKMLQHWRINNPDFRELQFKKRQEMVKQAWQEQIEEKQAKSQEEEVHKEQGRLKEEEEIKRKAKIAEEETVQRQLKMDEWKKSIEDQIKELQSRQEEEERLKKEIAHENQRLKEVDQAEKKRKDTDASRIKTDLGNFLKRQHRIKLLVKAREVEEELTEDLKILEELKSFTAKKGEEERLKVLEARTKQLEWLDGVLIQQKAEEAKRRQQMEQLFSEEAKKLWEKQEKTWEAEKEARKQLMNDVLSTLSTQTKAKLIEKEKRKDEILLEKEILTEGIEKLKIDVENEQKKEIEKRKLFVEDLDAQIEEKDKNDQNRKRESVLNDKLRMEMMWDQRTRDRNELAQKLSKWSFSPTDTPVITDFRRRKAKWY